MTKNLKIHNFLFSFLFYSPFSPPFHMNFWIRLSVFLLTLGASLRPLSAVTTFDFTSYSDANCATVATTDHLHMLNVCDSFPSGGYFSVTACPVSGPASVTMFTDSMCTSFQSSGTFNNGQCYTHAGSTGTVISFTYMCNSAFSALQAPLFFPMLVLSSLFYLLMSAAF